MKEKVSCENLRNIIYRCWYNRYTFLVLVIGVLFCFTIYLNNFFTDIFLSKFSAGINNRILDYSKTRAIIVAPIVEETIKFVGYGLIFLVPFKFLQSRYRSKEEFINENIVSAFLISAGLFGVFEGWLHNGPMRIGFCLYVLLNVCIHITFSLYPFILGRHYRNWFVCFLPIAMLLHSAHNFIITLIWDNKWVTFIMVTIFLVPFVILERNSIFQYIRKFKIHGVFNSKSVVYPLFIGLYILMFLGVMFYH